jgi:hypothetical protein
MRHGGSMAMSSIVNFTSVGDYGCWKIRVSFVTILCRPRHWAYM